MALAERFADLAAAFDIIPARSSPSTKPVSTFTTETVTRPAWSEIGHRLARTLHTFGAFQITIAETIVGTTALSLDTRAIAENQTRIARARF